MSRIMLFGNKHMGLLAATICTCITHLSSAAPLATYSRNDTFEVIGSQIVVNGRATVFTGVNVMHVYGGNSNDFPSKNISMVREFVGAVQHTPIIGGEWAHNIDGEWLHPLSKIVDNNEENGLVTILDLHRWNKSGATEFWAKIPSQTEWYDAYLERVMTEFPALLQGRPNVFLGIWNEAFHWDNTDGHMDTDSELWFDEMNALITAIRGANITNILVVPCGRMGQDESILLRDGQRLLDLHTDIVFEVHAYNRWLIPLGNTPSAEANIRSRLNMLRSLGLPIIVSEVGPSIASTIRDPQPLLDVARDLGTSVLAWQWCGADGNALMDSTTNCADRIAPISPSLDWAATFFDFMASQSETSPRLAQLPEREKKVFLHYVPWFSDVGSGGARHGWCAAGDSACTTDTSHRQYVGAGPAIGEYDQYDGNVIEYHLLLAHAANTHGLVVNINPTSQSQREILSIIVDKTAELHRSHPDFQVKLILSYDDATAVESETIQGHLASLRDLYLHNTSVSFVFFKDDEFTGRIPIFFWSDQGVDLYNAAADAVFVTEPKILTINRNARKFNFGHGNMAWIGTMSTATTLATNWGQSYLTDFEWRMKNQFQLDDTDGVGRQLGATLQVGCVWPGFNDSNVPVSWNGGISRVIAETVDDGITLELAYNFAINRAAPTNDLLAVPVDMPWLQVATFNDWPEGTAVEPSADAEDAFRRLRIVQSQSAAFASEGRYGLAEADVALTFPNALLELRRQQQQQHPNGLISDAVLQQAIDAFAIGNATIAMQLLSSQPGSHLAVPLTIRSTEAPDQLELLRTLEFGDGLVILEDSVNVGQSAGTSAVLTKQCFDAHSVEAIVSFEEQNHTSLNYQAKVNLIASQVSTVDSSAGIGDHDARLTRNIHAGIIDHTWLSLANASDFVINDAVSERQGAGKMRIKITQAQTAQGSVYFHGDGWTIINDYQKGDTVEIGSGCFYIGVELTANYNNIMSIPLNYLRIMLDTDGDGLYDHLETHLGANLSMVDTDSDGVNDDVDPKPTDDSTSTTLPIPITCSDGRDVRMQAGNGGVFVFIGSGPSSNCVLSFDSVAIQWNAPHTLAHAVDLHGDVPTRYNFNSSDSSVTLPIRKNEDHVFQLVDADFPPIANTDLTELVFETNATFELNLATVAYDIEDSAQELVWSVASVHIASELRIVIDMATNTATFIEDSPDCQTHNVILRVVDSGSNVVDIAFNLYILQSGEAELALENADFETVGSSVYTLEGWKGYTWAGTYDSHVSETNTSVDHGRSMQIEGLSKGRYGIYQYLSNMSTGTYQVNFMLAHREVVYGDYSNSVDILFITKQPGGGDDLIIEKVDVTGDSDGWVSVQLKFTVDFEVPRPATFYLRFFGTGFVFFDDVRLVKLLCHQPLTERQLTISSKQYDLVFEFPFRVEVDGVLCGYCGDNEQSEVCGRCRDANYTFVPPTNGSEPFIIASFEEGDDMPFQLSSWSYDTTTFEASRAANIVDTYISAYDTGGLISDWSNWDMVKVDVYNPSSQVEQFYVEIRDTQSTGYWSRVNWYTAVAPGFSTVTVPLQIFVGEKTVTVERRRLDRTAITRLVFASTLCHCDLTIDNVRLESEPAYVNLFSTLLRFDFGLESSPLEIGFSPVTEGDWYRSRLGYGINTDSVIPRSEDRRHPTDLLRDWISFQSGGVDIDLPNGDYWVWLVIEDPGYWEFFPSFNNRKVTMEGVDVLDETMTYSQFLEKYFHHQDTEDLPGDDIFANYVKPRYQPLLVETTVSDSQLNIEFETANTYACTLSSLVIFPKEQEQLGMGFLTEVWDRMKSHFDVEYAEAVYPATNDNVDANEARPFPLFARPLESVVRAFDKPLNSDRNLWEKGWEVNGIAIGETTSITFALQPQAVHKTITTVAFNTGFPAQNVNMFSVRSKIKRLSESVYTAIPLLMDPLALPLSLRPSATRQLLIQFDFSSSGCFAGNLSVTFADGGVLKIPIAAFVSQFALEPVPDSIWIGYLGSGPIVTGTTFTEFAAVEQAGFEASVNVLKDLGMTGISGGLGGPLVSGYDTDGNIQVDFTDSDATMSVLDQHWAKTTPVNSYFGLTLRGVSTSSSTWNAASTSDVFGKSYAEVVKDVLEAVDLHSTDQDWRDLFHNLGDEPSDDTALTVMEVAQVFRDANANALTSVFTSIESNTSVKVGFADNIDLIILNHHNEEAIEALKARNPNTNFMLYNQASRYRSGAYLYKLMTLGGKGHLQFALSSPGADPYYALDAREDDYCLLFLKSDGSMLKTLKTETARDAVLDLRYVLTLDAVVSAGIQIGDDADAFAAVENYLADLRETMAIGTDETQLTHTQLGSIRTNITHLMTALRHPEDLGAECTAGDTVAGAQYTPGLDSCGDDGVGEFVLVFRQTASPTMPIVTDWSSYNEVDPSNDTYSIWNQVEDYRLGNGSFIFKLNWENATEGAEIPHLIWTQTTNPHTVTTAGEIGDVAVIEDDTDGRPAFAGLSKSSARWAHLDGNPSMPWWYYAVGVNVLIQGGIPAYNRDPVQRTELYVCAMP